MRITSLAPAFLVSSIVLGLFHCKGGECDDSACAEGNQCVEENGVTECRLTCEAQQGPTGCPFNYTCKAAEAGDVNYCSKNSFAPNAAPGQWGTSCQPQNGLENPACDSASGFYCLAQSPSDANAFCTLYDCRNDSECAGGYYCGTRNVGPNAETRQRTSGESFSVCLPRGYCAPCSDDVDCGKAEDGSQQFCVPDLEGKGYCAKSCLRNSNCADEAECKPLTDTQSVCIPVAGTCVGDGQFCSPCRSDADCTGGGICSGGSITTERFCTIPATEPCAEGDGRSPAKCPQPMPERAAEGSFSYCATSEAEKDQCVGLLEYTAPLFLQNQTGQLEEYPAYDFGCYAQKRCERRRNDGSNECLRGR